MPSLTNASRAFDNDDGRQAFSIADREHGTVAVPRDAWPCSPDPWTRKLFLALCRRYGLKPFREPGRRYSTIQVRAPQTFHDRTLWPEFKALSEELRTHLDELTERVIREAIDEDVSEAAEAATPKALPESSGG